MTFDERSHDMGARDRPGEPKVARRAWLFEALATLPLNLRQVLKLQLEGFDYGKVAELLCINPDDVGVRLHRARKRLRQRSREDYSGGD